MGTLLRVWYGVAALHPMSGPAPRAPLLLRSGFLRQVLCCELEVCVVEVGVDVFVDRV